MKVSAFLSMMLVFAILWMQVYHSARETYNGISDLRAEVSALRQNEQKLKLARELDREHFLEFRQTIATLMPDVLKEKSEGEENYVFRGLASILTRKESEELRKTIARTLFERGKDYFNKGEFSKANRNFQQIVDRFGYTTFVAEAYFLMAEGYFKLGELEECTTAVQHMIELFPQHELTGLAMIRLGRIYQIQNRNEEAVDIYKTVLRSYPQRDVSSQAKASLKGVEL